MKIRGSARTGRLLPLLLIAGGGAWLLPSLPDGLPRSLAVILLGMLVVAAYMLLLVLHVREILRGRQPLWWQGLVVLAELTLLLSIFAVLYMRLGIIDNTRPGSPVVHDFWLSVYLSVVTFTTVGYGDMYPTGLGRALAALQGISGYLALGVLASTAASLVSPYSPAGPFDEERAREQGREEGREEERDEEPEQRER